MDDSQLQLNFGGPHQVAEVPGPRLGRYALESMDRRAIRRIKANYGQRSSGHFYAIANNGYALTWGGQGQKPAWIQEWLAEGRSLTEIECLLNEVTA